MTTATRSSAQKFGLNGRPSHRGHCQRATELVDVPIWLWDSGEDGAELGGGPTLHEHYGIPLPDNQFTVLRARGMPARTA